MKIELTGQSKLSDIKKLFNNSFEYLKLEFFKVSHQPHEPSSIKELIKEDFILEDINSAIKKCSLDVIPTMKVMELESLFKEELDLNLQVFRKSGTVWLETCGTDEMTLDEENKMGKEKSFPVQEDKFIDFDYD